MTCPLCSTGVKSIVSNEQQELSRGLTVRMALADLDDVLTVDEGVEAASHQFVRRELQQIGDSVFKEWIEDMLWPRSQSQTWVRCEGSSSRGKVWR